MRQDSPGRREIALLAAASAVLAIFWKWPLVRAITDHLGYLGSETPGIAADGVSWRPTPSSRATRSAW